MKMVLEGLWKIPMIELMRWYQADGCRSFVDCTELSIVFAGWYTQINSVTVIKFLTYQYCKTCAFIKQTKNLEIQNWWVIHTWSSVLLYKIYYL